MEPRQEFRQEFRQALKEQYHAGLSMLAECVEKCPADLWSAGEHPRTFWGIAWHAAYFAHNYLVQDEDAFNDSAADWPPGVRAALGVSDTQKAIDVEPYELPVSSAPLTQAQLREYLSYLCGIIDGTVDTLDLDRLDTGFSWYPHMTKLSHELMNLRHLQGHIGQLSERLMARQIEIIWVGHSSSLEH